LRNHKPFWIVMAVFLIIAVALVIALMVVNVEKEGNIPPVTEETILSDTSVTTVPIIQLPVLKGNTTLTEERAVLLDTGILAEIERLCTGTPKEDETGNFLTDEQGQLIYESNCDVDYSEMEENLSVIINHFADKGYTDTAILQIQRYYFHYARAFAKYQTENVLEKMERCFPADGTNPEDLTKQAKEVFGQIREDGFPFVFEAPVAVSDIKVVFGAVKPWGNTTLSEEREALCIYDWLNSGCESQRNLEGWLHKIINEMADYGYGEREMLLAQILYAGSLVEAEYRYDIMDALRACIPTEKEATVETWLRNVQSIFDVNLLDNVAFLDYLEGKTAYENGVM